MGDFTSYFSRSFRVYGKTQSVAKMPHDKNAAQV